MSTQPPPPARPLYLGDGPNATFGFLHQPASDSTSTLAVLICPPFGWEDICSYRARRDWAAHLAAAGHPALRIDFPGSGDSAGSPRDPDRLSAWSGAVALAASRLREIPGCERVAAIGIGLGGLAICSALAANAPIDEIVLWAVPARGKTLVRELHAFSRLEASGFDESQGDELSTLPEGYTSVGGFVLSADTLAALQRLDLSAPEFRFGSATRALLLERDGIAVDARLHDRIQAAGLAVTVAPGAGFGEMMAKPHHARSPTDVFAQVQAWLEGPASSRVVPQPSALAPSADHTVEHPRASDADSLRLTVDGVSVRETPLTFVQPFGDLLGILAEPLEREPVDLCLVMLNAGAIRRIGPNRMWVEMARRWAARGVPTLRLDLEGIGDADGDGDRFTELGELYVPELVDQVRATLDAMEARGVGDRFVLSGLCSGAYWAFQGALLDERVTAAIMLNPKALFWDPTLEITRDFRRGMLRPSSWRTILRGDIPAARIAAFARQAPLVLSRRLLARRSARSGGERIPRAFDRLRDTDKQLRFLFCSNEALYEELELAGLLDQLDRWPNVGVEEIPGTVHTLRPFTSQRAAHEACDRALERALRRADDQHGARRVV
jgi:pimeloyl-ACP methyl ester carboxylesterase